MESISKRDFRKIYTASKKSARGKWKISLFSKRISLNWNWQRDFCYETTNIQPHRSTSKLLAIRDKGPDISRIRSKYYSLSWYLFNLNLFYWYERIVLYWCYATVTSLLTYLKLVRATLTIFLLVIPYFYAIGSNLDKETIFFLKRLKRREKAETGANVVLLNFT